MADKLIPDHHNKRLQSMGAFLRELRLSEGMTQLELSKSMNYHRNTIIRGESGNNMTILTLFNLLDAFEMNLNEFFQDIE